MLMHLYLSSMSVRGDADQTFVRGDDAVPIQTSDRSYSYLLM